MYSTPRMSNVNLTTVNCDIFNSHQMTNINYHVGDTPPVVIMRIHTIITAALVWLTLNRSLFIIFTFSTISIFSYLFTRIQFMTIIHRVGRHYGSHKPHGYLLHWYYTQYNMSRDISSAHACARNGFLIYRFHCGVSLRRRQQRQQLPQRLFRRSPEISARDTRALGCIWWHASRRLNDRQYGGDASFESNR